LGLKNKDDIIDAAQKMLCAESKTFEYIEEEYYYNSKKEKVSVSFLPEGAVYVCSYYTNSLYVNRHKEIAIDQLGNYYKYSSTYDDLMPLYADVVPIDDGYEPTYDAANARLVTKWY
jgi:hypothetical protein